jgi:hypothetical protein
MQDPVRERLCSILTENGEGIVHQPDRLISLLRQTCGGYPTKVDLIVGALGHESVADLLRWKDQLPPQKLVPKLASNLQARLGCSRGEAVWAMVSWAVALRLLTEKQAEGISFIPSVGPQAAPSPMIGARAPRPSGSQRWVTLAPLIAGGLLVLAGFVYSVRCIDRLIKVDKPGAPKNTALDPKKEKVRFEPLASWEIRSPPYDLTFRDGSQALYSLGGDSVLTRWDAGSGAALQTLKVPGGTSGAILSPDGRTLAVAAGEGVAFYDVGSGMAQGDMKGYPGRYLEGAFSPDGRFLISGGDGTGLTVWDLTWKKPLLTMPGMVQSSMPEPISFSADGRGILVPNLSGSSPIILQSGTEHMEVLRRFEGHKGGANVAVFDRESTRVATASPDQTLRIWDAANAKELKRIEAEGVVDAVFHPDLPLIFARIGNGGIRVWRTDTGEEVGRLPETLGAMALGQDGELLAASGWRPSEDKTKAAPLMIKVWRVSTSALSR